MRFQLTNLDLEHEFPDVTSASREGLLAYGGDLSVDRLIRAYSSGIFPWYEASQPILWWSPDPRFVLFPNKLKVSKSMKKFIRETHLNITFNRAFEDVISECAMIKRQGQSSTWITPEMKEAYLNLFKSGKVVSVEVWDEDRLVGGLYGVALGNGIFSGESMFSKTDNASKFALIGLIKQQDYKLIDCQVYTNHLASLGAEEITRNEFIKLLND